MRKLLIVACAIFFCVGIKAQDFSSSTTTQTLQEETMAFKFELTDEQYTSLILWSQKTNLGATLEMADLNKGPNSEKLHFTYEIVDFSTVNLFVKGNKFMIVKLHKNTAYLYLAKDNELKLKLPRVL